MSNGKHVSLALGACTDDELKAELLRREAERRVKENALLMQQHEFVLKNVDVLLRIVFPEHDRTSCDDAHIENSNGGDPQYKPRCRRCQLLYIQQYDYNDSVVLDAQLQIRQVHPVEQKDLYVVI